MKAPGVLAVLLSVSLPGGAFAQNISAASRAGASSEAGVAGTIGTIQTAPSLIGGMPSLSLSPASLTPGLMPAPSAVLAPAIAPVAAIAVAPAVALAVAASAAEPVKSAALAGTISHTAAKSETAPATWTAKLAAMFDGFRGKKNAEEDLEPVDPGSLKVFVVEHGKPMRTIPLTQAASFGGRVRLLSAKNDPRGVTDAHAKQVSQLIGAKIQNEDLAVDWNAKPGDAEKNAAAAPKGLKAVLTWPFREAKFLAKSFKASLVKPEASEIIGGIVTKSFPLVTALGVYWATAGLAHPFVLAGLVTLSIAQEVFHGIYLKSWNNFQGVLLKDRGFNYQLFFNFAYVQTMGTLYRLLSWVANPASVTPPWTTKYWQDMAVMSVAGTFFGVLGYNSLNQLYDKGVLKRWQHSGIQQMRDFCMLLAAPFFASGSMTVFWTIFIIQQLFDIAIAIWAGRAKAKPVVFIVSDALAATPEFEKKYPEGGATIEPPLKTAANALVNNVFVKVATWPARALWKLVRRAPAEKK